MSLREKEESAAAGAVAPRVSLQDIEGEVEFRHVFNGLNLAPEGLLLSPIIHQALGCLTVSVIVLKNGFVVVGTSACASPANYKRELGEKFAYEHGLQQLWGYFGFLLRDSQHKTARRQEPPQQ